MTRRPRNDPLTLQSDGETQTVITRQFAARPELVWRSHTEPALLQRWCLGPDGWTMPVCICEPRPDGRLRHEWAKDGRGFYISGEFIALSPVSRIEHVERMHLPDPTPDNHVVTEFIPHNGGTRMAMTLPDSATRQAMLASGMADGMEIGYQRQESMMETV